MLMLVFNQEMKKIIRMAEKPLVVFAVYLVYHLVKDMIQRRFQKYGA